jgi:hypothetical protein
MIYNNIILPRQARDKHRENSKKDGRFSQAFKSYGLCKDEFQDTDHWPPQLYVRAARRLVGARVFTQNVPATNRDWGNLSIGCGSYNFDSHTAERFACPNASLCGAGPSGTAAGNAFAWNEGDVETAPGVYDIPRWVLLPKEEEAVNLLVVASPSASHIGKTARPFARFQFYTKNDHFTKTGLGQT